MEQYIEDYVNELANIIPCDEAENDLLARRILKGDDDAEMRIIEGNLYLVLELVVKYEACGLPVGDLIQEGNVALMEAVAKYKEAKIVSNFTNFASNMIENAISKFIELESKEKLASKKLEIEANKLFEVTKDFEEENGRPATLKELAELMNLPEDEVELVLRASYSAIEQGDVGDGESAEGGAGYEGSGEAGFFGGDAEGAEPIEGAEQDSDASPEGAGDKSSQNPLLSGWGDM